MKRQTAFEKWWNRWVGIPYDRFNSVFDKDEIKSAFQAGFRAGRAHTERLSK